MSTATPEAPVAEQQHPSQTRPIPVNFWGADETTNVYLGNQKEQYFTIKKMNEGEKAKFQKLTSQDMVVDRNNEGRIRVDQAAERHALITQSVTDWMIYEFPTDGSDPYPCPFSKQQLNLWLQKADPKLVTELESEIRDFNPWMLNELPVEEIQKEIDKLEEMKRKRIEQDAGEATSANR